MVYIIGCGGVHRTPTGFLQNEVLVLRNGRRLLLNFSEIVSAKVQLYFGILCKTQKIPSLFEQSLPNVREHTVYSPTRLGYFRPALHKNKRFTTKL